MPEWFWWIVAIWISVRMLWWLWGPKPKRRIRLERPRDDAHDAAISVAAMLGTRDGLKGD